MLKTMKAYGIMQIQKKGLTIVSPFYGFVIVFLA